MDKLTIFPWSSNCLHKMSTQWQQCW